MDSLSSTEKNLLPNKEIITTEKLFESLVLESRIVPTNRSTRSCEITDTKLNAASRKQMERKLEDDTDNNSSSLRYAYGSSLLPENSNNRSSSRKSRTQLLAGTSFPSQENVKRCRKDQILGNKNTINEEQQPIYKKRRQHYRRRNSVVVHQRRNGFCYKNIDILHELIQASLMSSFSRELQERRDNDGKASTNDQSNEPTSHS